MPMQVSINLNECLSGKVGKKQLLFYCLFCLQISYLLHIDEYSTGYVSRALKPLTNAIKEM